MRWQSRLLSPTPGLSVLILRPSRRCKRRLPLASGHFFSWARCGAEQRRRAEGKRPDRGMFGGCAGRASSSLLFPSWAFAPALSLRPFFSFVLAACANASNLTAAYVHGRAADLRSTPMQGDCGGRPRAGVLGKSLCTERLCKMQAA